MNNSFKKYMRILAAFMAIVSLFMLFGCGSEQRFYYSELPAESKVSERVYDFDYELHYPTATEFTVANYFTDNCVLPRNTGIVIWGFAPEEQNGNYVFAEFKGLQGSGVIENGAWEVVLQGKLEASSELGNTLTVRGLCDLYYEFHDVLVGDIWIVTGQSNAALTFSAYNEFQDYYKDFLDALDGTDNFRIFNQNQNAFDSYNESELAYEHFDTCESVKWQKPTKENILSFSMLGTFFAEKLLEHNPDVPLGIINASIGGVPLCALASQAAVNQYPDEMKLTTPGKVYNVFIAPLTKLHITGMIMYQGECEAIYYYDYAEILRTTIYDYRSTFGTNFEFINIQLTSYGLGVDGQQADSWDCINLQRFAQAEVSIDSTISNYDLVASYDVGYQEGDPDTAHPIYKQELGERAANIAAAKIYGINTLENVGSPIPSQICVAGKKITITFENVATSLSVLGFDNTISGADITEENVTGFEYFNGEEWLPAENAHISSAGNQVIISGVTNASGVRYAPKLHYTNATSEANLISGSGVPACAFEVNF